MQLTIGKKTYDLKFGFGFLEEIDKRYTIDQNGFDIGIGVVSANVYLRQANPLVLKNLIQAATSEEKSKPSVKDIETYMEQLASEDKLDDLFIEFIEELGKSPFTKSITKRQEEAIQASLGQ